MPMLPAAPPNGAIARAPRPWLTRLPGECAFPVAGESLDTRSCCNPSGRFTYCPAHRARLRGPWAPDGAAMEKSLARYFDPTWTADR